MRKDLSAILDGKEENLFIQMISNAYKKANGERKLFLVKFKSKNRVQTVSARAWSAYVSRHVHFVLDTLSDKD